MAGVLNIENLKGKPLFQSDEGLTPEQLAGLDKAYLIRGVRNAGEGRGKISPRLYDILKRFGWEKADLGIPVGALIEASRDELVVSTRSPRWLCGQYGLGPKGLEELEATLTSLIASE